jgi:hypothetical protein
MTTGPRRRRPAVVRTEPIRNVGLGPSSTSARAPSPDPGPPPHVAPSSLSSAQDAVSMAYAVAGENFAEGRLAAERLRAAAPPLSTTRDVSAVAQRLMHMSKDMGAAWVELIVALLREPDLRAAADRMSGRDRPPAAAPVSPGPPAWLVQRISSRRPVEVTVSAMVAAAPALPPLIAGLHSLTAGVPPIGQVVFRNRPGGGLEVQIDVPDDQPPGVYAGAFVDAEAGRPIGALSVRVFE